MKFSFRYKAWQRWATVCLAVLCAALAAYGLWGRSGQRKADSSGSLQATHLGGDNTIQEVADEMKKAGLEQADRFADWARDFADTAGKAAELADAWDAPSALRPDLARVSEGWTAHHAYSDADCRMTAFMLLDGVLTAQSAEPDYQGTYLMFDVEAVDTVPRYQTIRQKRDMFTTLFGEKQAEDAGAAARSFEQAWRQYGFLVRNQKARLLSLVVYDPHDKVTFVGHAGVLLKTKDGLLFVEKIAFEQPYQATRAKTLDEVLAVLGTRPEYFGEADEPGPFVYLNGVYQGKLRKTAP